MIFLVGRLDKFQLSFWKFCFAAAAVANFGLGESVGLLFIRFASKKVKKKKLCQLGTLAHGTAKFLLVTSSLGSRIFESLSNPSEKPHTNLLPPSLSP